MEITFSAANTVGLNNPGTEIITLVKDGSGNFINPPSYDKMRAYLRSGEVPLLFVTTEGGETGSLYQLDEYSETENKIRFSNSTNAIEFCAGCEVPVVSDVGGGGGSGSGQFIVVVYNANSAGTIFQSDKTYNEISAAIESGISVVIHKKKTIGSANYNVFYLTKNKGGVWGFCNYESTFVAGAPAEVLAKFIDIYEENGEMHIEQRIFKLQIAT